MKRTMIVPFALLLSVTLVIGAHVRFASAQASSKVYRLKMQSHMPLENINFVRTQRWAKMWEEASNGRVKVSFYPSSQLAPSGEALDALAAGAFELLVTGGNSFAGKNYMSGFLELPGRFPSYRAVYDAWWNKGVREIVDKVYQRKSHVKALSLQFVSWSTLLAKRPVRTLEDWKGLKVGALGKIRANYMKAVGASAVNIGPADQYIALQRGTIDAAVQSISSGVRTYHLDEVCKYAISDPLLFPMTLQVWINPDVWNKLPPDLQKAAMDTAKQATSDDADWANEILAKDSGYCTEKGVELIKIPSDEYQRWRKAVAGLADSWLETAAQQGFLEEAKEVLKIADSY